MFIAMKKDTKHSDKILNLLLDCDILFSQEVEIGYPIEATHFTRDKEHRLIEILLKSGRFNANATAVLGRTWLHLAEDEKLASLLIHHADVNRKDVVGMTPLMLSGWKPILEESGTLVDLNAVDFNGETALIEAVKDQKSDKVELLLSAGASVNLSDHLGFTALHHALHLDRYWEHVQFPRNCEELRKRKEMAILFHAEKPREVCNWYARNEEWNERRMKTVEMLLQRPDIDVNALSFENFSPLDIAEGQIPEIPQSIKDALKEKGAVLNIFKQVELQSTSEFYLDVRCKLILKRLVDSVIVGYIIKKIQISLKRYF